MAFGDRLRSERKKNKLSAQAFADACGLSRSYITLIENNKRLPGKRILRKIGEPLNLQPSAVITWYLEDIKEKLE
jgi:transcriptional regulator with XRE-family HTH domain